MNVLIPLLLLAGCSDALYHCGDSNAGVAPEATPGADSAGELSYVSDVEPLIERHCLSCHSGAAPEGALDLSGGRESLVDTEAPSGAGILVVAGDTEKSVAFGRVVSGSMPPSGPLSAEDVALIEAWILGGAQP